MQVPHDLPGAHLASGDLPGGPGEGSYRTFCQTVLSAVSSLISVLDRGGCFSFLFSASLFALSLEREFSYGRKCSRADQIIVLVTFVPGQQRKYQPDPFSRTELSVHFRESLGGSPAGGKLERLCEHFLRSRSMSCLGFVGTTLAGIFYVDLHLEVMEGDRG